MKTYRLEFEHKLPIPLAETWDFFTSPLNLAKITPPQMGFEVTSPYDANSKVYEGMIITYKITPLFGIKMDWMTEITHVKEHQYFIDEQRFGPYALWHHEHHFEEIKGGVNMKDILYYAIPYGAIGKLANSILVANEVNKIFTHREQAINEMFGVYKG
ncbi:SRPBCC family protein [Mucilaginibacter antarcticus]|uniref:Ligand-binding SRPBCC domain-containing protein n=1 Tax=Mucilaginibacter antarcticus TaxID=1855725 RepID=A0ABW5XPT1_9SPHI